MKRKDPPKQQRNALCSCGSGKKYKKCHLLIEREEAVKAAAELEELRRSREAARRKELENLAGTLRERWASDYVRSPSYLMPITLLASAALMANHPPRSRFK